MDGASLPTLLQLKTPPEKKRGSSLLAARLQKLISDFFPLEVLGEIWQDILQNIFRPQNKGQKSSGRNFGFS